MAIVSLPEIMDTAFQQRYGVAAFNAVDDITMDGLIRAAEESHSPLIIQISVKTVHFWGEDVIKDMFTDMASRVAVPVTLHLDHCPDPAVAETCLKVGWNSVLFDGSGLSYEENFVKTGEIVKMAGKTGASVEGELVAVGGVEDGIGSEQEGDLLPIAKEIEFIQDDLCGLYPVKISLKHNVHKDQIRIFLFNLFKGVSASDSGADYLISQSLKAQVYVFGNYSFVLDYKDPWFYVVFQHNQY